MFTEKAAPLCLLQVLTEYSDENHVLPMRDIISKLNSQYGISPDRRTIYSAVSLLVELGYDISVYEENGNGYFLCSRTFEPTEVRLLTDAVISFPFITAKQTEELVSKLQSVQSINERKKYRNLNVIRSPRKSANCQVFLNIEMLDEAITDKVKVKFDYLEYDDTGKLKSRRDRKYTVNPYGMVYQNEHYYLICVLTYQEKVSLYRIDKIRDLEITEYGLDERERDFDPKRAVKDAVYAFTGEPEDVVMLCDRSVLDNVIDKFGNDVRIIKCDNERAEVRFSAPPKGVKFWALQYLPYVEVIKPQWLRDEIVESVKSNPYI